VADTPPLCDFYLGSIVQKGDLKIAISTNGKSPTLAKRIRAFLEDVIPEDIQTSLDQLEEARKTLKGDFQQKITQLNELTKNLIFKKKD
jgi:siroheme synthase-like protein